jgi:hypothetical protein
MLHDVAFLIWLKFRYLKPLDVWKFIERLFTGGFMRAWSQSQFLRMSPVSGSDIGLRPSSLKLRNTGGNIIGDKERRRSNPSGVRNRNPK